MRRAVRYQALSYLEFLEPFAFFSAVVPLQKYYLGSLWKISSGTTRTSGRSTNSLIIREKKSHPEATYPGTTGEGDSRDKEKASEIPAFQVEYHTDFRTGRTLITNWKDIPPPEIGFLEKNSFSVDIQYSIPLLNNKVLLQFQLYLHSPISTGKALGWSTYVSC
ncbi:UNVERIFIED_CONTAM: hypothetical protein PYX00_003580 [Menopon gallinae]|uniref:Uncharacterized protein n=1 Tax=Menopon gallinae TaxID=328185 RepID=A0AAW2I2B2_9NEOP